MAERIPLFIRKPENKFEYKCMRHLVNFTTHYLWNVMRDDFPLIEVHNTHLLTIMAQERLWENNVVYTARNGKKIDLS